LAPNFDISFEIYFMQQDPNQQRNKQPEEGTKEDLNATNSDASLIRGGNSSQPDAPVFSDSASTKIVNYNLTGSAAKGDEINPEYGDAADPTFETL
jgi:hypothetical protein